MELTIKELKLKRRLARRNSYTIPPIRRGLKWNDLSLSSEDTIDAGSIVRSVSLSPETGYQEHCSVFESSLKSSLNVNSLASLHQNEVSSDVHNTFHFTPLNLIKHEDNEQPLDMSMKVMPDDSTRFHKQQLRPSVITCASSLLKHHCNLSALKHQLCKTNTTEHSNNAGKRSQSINTTSAKKDEKTSHQQKFVTGSFCPDIDEHFRRSLGQDYHHIFKKSPCKEASITVDDHFAKALGDTWHQIQQSQRVSPVLSTSSSTSLKSEKSPTCNQSPEILS